MTKMKAVGLYHYLPIEDEKSLQDFMTRILKNAGFDLANLYLLDHNKVDSAQCSPITSLT